MSKATVAFVTLGCAKNEVDTQHMMRRVAQAGYEVVNDPEEANAVVVNTCSFIQSATEESIDTIFELAGLPNLKCGETKLIVAGCMPARYGEDLEAELGEVQAFVPCSKEEDIAHVLHTVLGIDEELPEWDLPATSEVSAYVKISDGCDRFCSYCTIPYIRGRYHSFSYADIYAEVQLQVSAGVKEIVLIAQDTGRWGTDFQEKSSLANLMSDLAESFPQTWFRVMYLQPEGITDELLSVMAGHDNICNYLDIPMQHVNADVLRSMNRRGSREEFDALLERVRAAVPGITLRTTLIAGFPGETDEQFEEMCEFVEEAGFDYVGVFAYSREEGTKSAELPNQIDDDEKTDRAQRLRDLADMVCTPVVASRIGQEMDVLIEGLEEDGQPVGRAMCQAPEVDGSVYVEGAKVGDIVHVKIIDTLFYEMEGEL